MTLRVKTWRRIVHGLQSFCTRHYVFLMQVAAAVDAEVVGSTMLCFA
jgi:hypothetical protein